MPQLVMGMGTVMTLIPMIVFAVSFMLLNKAANGDTFSPRFPSSRVKLNEFGLNLENSLNQLDK